jgi:hypothetical protein
MSFGGPNLGVFAAKTELVRGCRAARRRHRGPRRRSAASRSRCRRASSTSAGPRRRPNICTNVALVRAHGHHLLATVGKRGLVGRVGELSDAKAALCRERLAACPACRCASAARLQGVHAEAPKSPERVGGQLAKQGILAGLPLKSLDRKHATACWWPSHEKRTKTRSTVRRTRWPRRWRDAVRQPERAYDRCISSSPRRAARRTRCRSRRAVAARRRDSREAPAHRTGGVAGGVGVRRGAPLLAALRR